VSVLVYVFNFNQTKEKLIYKHKECNKEGKVKKRKKKNGAMRTWKEELKGNLQGKKKRSV